MARSQADGRPAPVASVHRAVRILEALASHAHGIALTDLSARLGYGKGTLSKILDTLERQGYVRQDPLTDRFHLSWRLLALAFGHAQRLGVPTIFFPILQELADETDELVQLALVDGDRLLFVAKAEGVGQRIRMLPLVGMAAPLHATASGKIWLASLPEAEARAILRREGLPPLAPKTMTDRRRLLADLREVRRRGYAVVDEELVEGGGAVAAPILNHGRVVGAVAVSGPTFRLPLARLHELAPRVQRAAEEVAAIWPLRVSAKDFGLGVRPGERGRVEPAFGRPP
ncbi:MAG: IclR family transcriptional regulator [Candidatus Rokubacteria bacterium]|nr:IclR family transcriptional regulator [Candidatus Rokubacteria bacterium]